MAAVEAADQIADTVRRYAEAGASTAVMQAAGTDQDITRLVDLAVATRAALRT